MIQKHREEVREKMRKRRETFGRLNKKTRRGQPVMANQIEHLLGKIQSKSWQIVVTWSTWLRRRRGEQRGALKYIGKDVMLSSLSSLFLMANWIEHLVRKIESQVWQFGGDVNTCIAPWGIDLEVLLTSLSFLLHFRHHRHHFFLLETDILWSPTGTNGVRSTLRKHLLSG